MELFIDFSNATQGTLNYKGHSDSASSAKVSAPFHKLKGSDSNLLQNLMGSSFARAPPILRVS